MKTLNFTDAKSRCILYLLLSMVPSKDMQTSPPLRNSQLFMKDAECAETNDMTIFRKIKIEKSAIRFFFRCSTFRIFHAERKIIPITRMSGAVSGCMHHPLKVRTLRLSSKARLVASVNRSQLRSKVEIS